MSMTETEKAVAAWLAPREKEMIALLETLVNVDSGSYDKEGVDKAGEVLKTFLAGHGLEIETIANADFGDAIRATLPQVATNDQRPIVLMGHRDTVFPKGEPIRRPFTIKDGRGYGPGVMDMKAGLVMNAFVAAAFAAVGGHPAPITLLITSDEEIASPACRPIIEAEARNARCVFNSEPSRAGNVITSGRKGGLFMRMEVTGKASHSGARYADGISAILELSRKVEALHAMTDLEAGITVNVGLIGGGQTVNTVAPSAWGEIDLRYITLKQRTEMLNRITKAVETCSLKGATAKLIIKGEFLPLEQTDSSRALFETYKGAGAEFGLSFSADFSGGCADSGFTSAMGCPTLCSVGPVGAHGHTPEEYCELSSLVPSAQVMALAVMRAAI